MYRQRKDRIPSTLDGREFNRPVTLRCSSSTQLVSCSLVACLRIRPSKRALGCRPGREPRDLPPVDAAGGPVPHPRITTSTCIPSWRRRYPGVSALTRSVLPVQRTTSCRGRSPSSPMIDRFRRDEHGGRQSRSTTSRCPSRGSKTTSLCPRTMQDLSDPSCGVRADAQARAGLRGLVRRTATARARKNRIQAGIDTQQRVSVRATCN